jgi:hypothetical protein
MKSISNSVRMLLVICVAFLVPRVYMTGGSDFTALKNRLFPSTTTGGPANASPASQATQTSQPAAEEKPPITITLDSIQHKEDISLPLPPDLKRSKPIPLVNLLRFDYVPNDIVNRWPYVTAVNPELHVQAYRAPFFTGTASEDLEGVVTYYFNAKNNTTQIMVRAKTGDFRPLVTWLKTHYGFEYREMQSPVVYVYEPPQRWPSKSDSYLWIRPAHAFAEGYDTKRFDVTLVLNRPKE